MGGSGFHSLVCSTIEYELYLVQRLQPPSLEEILMSVTLMSVHLDSCHLTLHCWEALFQAPGLRQEKCWLGFWIILRSWRQLWFEPLCYCETRRSPVLAQTSVYFLAQGQVTSWPWLKLTPINAPRRDANSWNLQYEKAPDCETPHSAIDCHDHNSQQVHWCW